MSSFPYQADASASGFDALNPAVSYVVDAVQRQMLFWDTMRQRGNQYREHAAKIAPHVLNYPVDLIMDGRTWIGRLIMYLCA
jgi:hypothetical protein